MCTGLCFHNGVTQKVSELCDGIVNVCAYSLGLQGFWAYAKVLVRLVYHFGDNSVLSCAR